jgi:hypothetical protein
MHRPGRKSNAIHHNIFLQIQLQAQLQQHLLQQSQITPQQLLQNQQLIQGQQLAATPQIYYPLGATGQPVSFNFLL